MNHKYDFTDPTTGVHTNMLKKHKVLLNSTIKNRSEAQIFAINNLKSYLTEFMWRKNSEKKKCFSRIIKMNFRNMAYNVRHNINKLLFL